MTVLRVLFVVPSLRRAGAESQVIQLANGLPEDKFDKHLLSYLQEDALKSSVDLNSVTHHEFRRRRKLDLGLVKKIGQTIDEREIDVVHCTLQNALMYGVLGAHFAKRNPSIICAIHTTKAASFKHELADALLYRHFLKRCDQVWLMCRSQAAIWFKRMPFLEARHQVIYNGVMVEQFDPGLFTKKGPDYRQKLGIPQEAIVICCVAGFRPEKLHDVLLNSFRRISRESEENCYLLLAGVGSTQERIQEMVENYELQRQVIFLGELEDIRPVLAASDFKVLPSVAETFSMAMLEAMAMGIPVISTRVGGSGEAIEDGKSGVLVAPGRVDELTDALRQLVGNTSRRIEMGRIARETVVEKFSYSMMIEHSAAKLMDVSVAA